jgi:hypothetical protein
MSIKSWHLAFAVTGLLALSGAAYAQSPWDEIHSRRAEINGHHLAHRNDRIREQRREHEIRAERLWELHHGDRSVRSHERSMAGRDHRHISPYERHALNQRLNYEGRQIGR